MKGKAIIESILKVMEGRGTIFAQITTRDEFDKDYRTLVGDCRKVGGELVGSAYVYSAFLDNETI